MRSDLNILYIIGQLARGGAERQLYHLLSALPGPATVLSLSQGGYWADPIRALGHTVIALERTGSWEWGRLVATVKILRQRQPDIVHIFCDQVGTLYARLAALIIRHPVVVVGERSLPAHHPAWYRRVLPRLNRAVSAIVCNSQTALERLQAQRIARLDQLHFIPNCIDLARFVGVGDEAVPEPPGTVRHPVVGTVANLTPQKNPLLFIEAAARVHQAQPQAQFWMIGDGPLRQPCQALIDALGLQEVVTLWGQRDDVPALLGRMDVFVLTSRYEGTPNALLEAMAARLPCVITDVGDASRIVREAEAGYVVEADEEAMALSQKILTLLGDACLRATMGQKGYACIQQRYTPDSMAARYQQLYTQLLAQ